MGEKVNDCCMYEEREKNGRLIKGCSALRKIYFELNVVMGDCGTVRCPFYKPKRHLIRRGNRFFYPDGRQYKTRG